MSKKSFARLVSRTCCYGFLLTLAGCGGDGCGSSASGSGGGGGPIGSISNFTFKDSSGASLSGPIASGKGLVADAAGLAAKAKYEVVVTGAKNLITAPNGEKVVSYNTVSTDKAGAIRSTLVTPLLEAGTYTMRVSRLEGTVVTPVGNQTFSVADGIGKGFRLGKGTEAFATKRLFAAGDSLTAKFRGFVAGESFDAYVIRQDTGVRSGEKLKDVSGFSENPDVPPGRLRLVGNPERVTISPDGSATVELWPNINAEANSYRFEVILDLNKNGTFEAASDFRQDELLGSFSVGGTRKLAPGGEIDIANNIDFEPQTLFAVNDLVIAVAPPTVPAAPGVGRVYVYRERIFSAGDALRLSEAVVAVDFTSPAPDLLLPTFILAFPDLVPGKYDVVVDLNSNGVFEPSIDYIDGQNGECYEVIGTTPATQKWTVMVYMNGDNSLSNYIDLDLNEMERVDYLTGTTSDVSVVTQADRTTFGDTARYLMAYDPENRGAVITGPVQKLGERDMGQASELEEFINWAKTYRPAEKYALILWDHGDGFRNTQPPTRSAKFGRPISQRERNGISYDDRSGNFMTIRDVHDVLKRTGSVDLLVNDACLMGSWEVVSEFQDVAKAYVGSQVLMPGRGIRYDLTLKSLVAKPAMTASELAVQVVDDFASDSTALGIQNEHLAAFDLTKMPALDTAIDKWSNRIVGDEDGNGLNGLYSPNVWRSMLDIKAFCPSVLRHETRVPTNEWPDSRDLKQVADFLIASVNIPYRTTGMEIRDALKAVVLKNFAGSAIPGRNGMSLWYPDRAEFDHFILDFEELEVSRRTKYGNFLVELYRHLYAIKVTSQAEFCMFGSADASGNSKSGWSLHTSASSEPSWGFDRGYHVIEDIDSLSGGRFFLITEKAVDTKHYLTVFSRIATEPGSVGSSEIEIFDYAGTSVKKVTVPGWSYPDNAGAGRCRVSINPIKEIISDENLDYAYGL